MSTFHGGPADQQILSLSRTPIMLRVVRTAAGGFDALDQLEDQARPDESIFVYRLCGKPNIYHSFLDGWMTAAHYQFLDEAIPDEALRDNARWVAWCKANKQWLIPEWASVKSSGIG